MKIFLFLLLMTSFCSADTPEIIDYGNSVNVENNYSLVWSTGSTGSTYYIYLDYFGNFYINGKLENNPKLIVKALQKWTYDQSDD